MTRPLRVVVSGASAGIGRASVSCLARAGFDVLACARDEAALATLASETGSRYAKLDIRDAAATDTLLCTEHADILVHAAGILGEAAALYDLSPQAVSDVIETNMTGTINLLRACLPSMLARQCGTIVLLGSICADTPGTGPTLYAATKAATQAIAANLRYDLRDRDIRVSEIRLGRVQTGIHAQLGTHSNFYDGFRCLNADDIADTILHIIRAPAHVDFPIVEIMPTRQVRGGAYFAKG
ncbi:SDR family NAD(P)-dependent oxidoreductase [Acetobacter sp. TBRC 12305]|uniref:SDR family NAD(P)-dependent oxidoreductase n=1 Tax=Acetobacter garciniae TaxID=2817435 RepID=A0A939KQY8_9PROT|nr:SDR family NAD(P)-dependent oxidoreductase [Acetobacter garciniae]MBO1326109.1 SDR family NAD(P)-dependent oxidoreductase [Acetobacter garciniae]MBX0345146.1 SDR family NAD(P)-dependent oxidoreductase [Acetobacter garciniae]